MLFIDDREVWEPICTATLQVREVFRTDVTYRQFRPVRGRMEEKWKHTAPDSNRRQS